MIGGKLSMKTCPRCHTELKDEANFCDNCGWNFNYKKKAKSTSNHSTKQRRWVLQDFQNATMDEIGQWLDERNGKIEIVPDGIQGALQYHSVNLGFSYAWECSFLKFRYYPNTSGHYYACRLATSRVMLTEDGAIRKNEQKLEEQSPNHLDWVESSKVIFQRIKKGYMQNGGRMVATFNLYEVFPKK